MTSVCGATSTLALDPGGQATFQWTSAWRGVLTLRMDGLRATHAMHVHDYYSVLVVDHGEAEIRCRGSAFLARPGSVILLSPWEAHEEVPLSTGGWSFRAFHPAPATMRRLLGVSPDIDLRRVHFDRPVADDGAFASQLDRVFTRLARRADGVIEDADTDAVRASLHRHLRSEPRTRELRGARAVTVARERIMTATRAMPSMTELAQLTGMSRFHLSRVFSDVTGMPPYSYFEQVRLARAKALLRRGHGISHVAMSLGYSDQSHFHRQFRDRAASTPGRYARALQSVFCADGRSAQMFNRGVDSARIVGALQA